MRQLSQEVDRAPRDDRPVAELVADRVHGHVEAGERGIGEELELPLVGLEVRKARPHEAHRHAPRVELPQQPPRQRLDLLVERRRRKRDRRLVVLAVRVADPDPHRARAEAELADRADGAVDEVEEDALELAPVRRGLLERRLAGDLLGDLPLVDRTRVLTARPFVERDADLAEHRLERRERNFAELADTADVHVVEERRGLGPHAGDLLDRQRQEEGLLLPLGDLAEPPGLDRLGRELGQHAVLRDADRDGEADLVADLALAPGAELLQVGIYVLGPAEVGEGLVEEGLERRGVAAADLPRRLGEAAVDVMAAVEHDELGADPQGLVDRHRGGDAERARLVAGRGDDPVAHGDRFSPQPWIAKLLDGRKARVHVDVHDPRRHDYTTKMLSRYQIGSPSRWQRMQTSPDSAVTEKKYLIGRVARSTQRALTEVTRRSRVPQRNLRGSIRPSA